MKWMHLILAMLPMLILYGCKIDPPLHLRRLVEAEVAVDMNFEVDMMWQIDWHTEWNFDWKTEVWGPLEYDDPASIRMHTYTLGADGERRAHTVNNFAGMEGTVSVFVGTHDLLFHNNDSEVLLFRADEDLSPIHAYTRVISSGLKGSIPVQTTSQKEQAKTKDSVTDMENEPVTFQPDELFRLFDPAHYVSDNLADYDYIDGRYVLRIEGELTPGTFIYLIQVRLLNNLGRVTGSVGGGALTGVADGVNLETGVTHDNRVSVPFDVYLNQEADPDLLGARVMTFGIPACNPYDSLSVKAAPQTPHYLVLNVTFATGHYKNVRVDITDLFRDLPTGGVITLELDVNDFPPEEIDPPVDEGGGFNPVIGEWNEQVGTTTIIN